MAAGGVSFRIDREDNGIVQPVVGVGDRQFDVIETPAFTTASQTSTVVIPFIEVVRRGGPTGGGLVIDVVLSVHAGPGPGDPAYGL